MSFKIILLLLLWALTICVLIFNLLFTKNGFYTNGTILIGWILFILQYTINSSERIYMLLQKAKKYIFNSSSQWDFQYEFKSKEFSIEKFSEELERDLGIKKDREINLSRKQLTLNNGIKVEISKDIVNENVVLLVEDLKVSYRDSLKIIDYTLFPLIEKITTQNSVLEEKFTFNISFEDYNPYYGYLVKKISDQNKMTQFYINLNIESGEVSILSNQIMITANKFSDISRISKEYLTMSTASIT